MRQSIAISNTRRHAPALAIVSLLFGVLGCSGAPDGTGPVSAGPERSPGASPSHLALPVLQNVTLDAARAVSDSFGPAGGALEVTDVDGVRYRLELPPGSLVEDTAILAVPITSITGLPPEAEVASAIHLEPEGLVLRVGATLTIERPSTPDRAVLAFAYRADLVDPFRFPAIVAEPTVTIPIVHFSGYGLLQATSAATSAAELGLEMGWQPPDGPTDRALGEIASVIDGDAANRAQLVGDALRQWIDEGFAPLVTAFRAIDAWNAIDFFDLGVRIRAEFELWDYVSKLATLSGIPIDPALETRIRLIAVAVGTHAVEVTNTDCIVTPAAELAHLRIPEVGFWLDWAGGRELSESHELLDPAFVAANLCVGVRLLPEGGVAFPAAIQPGQAGTLALRVGLQVTGVSEVHGAGTYDVVVTPSGADPAGVAIGTTDLGGQWSRDFTWAASATALRLDIRACLPAPLGAVCDVETVVRGATSTNGPATAAPNGTCPTYVVVVDGATHSGTGPDGVSVAGVTSSGSALGTKSVILNAFDGGAASARIVAPFTVDATLAGSGPFEITVAFYGRVQDASGGKATVRLTVGEVTKRFTSPQTAVTGADVGPGTLEIPITVQDGSLVTITVEAAAGSDGGRTTLTGGIQLLGRPEQVIFAHPGCP